MRRLAALGLLVGALALVAAGCGGDDGGSSSSDATDTATWASGFCQAVDDLGKGISEAGQGLTTDGLPSSDDIADALESAAAAVRAFGDDISDLGTPDLPSGEEITTRIQDATDDAQQAFDDAKDQVDGEINSAADVAVAAGAIADATQKALTQIGNATSNLEQLDPEGKLKAEFEDAEECVGLGGS